MNASTQALIGSEVTYPESDGKPMADNRLQFHWIVLIKEGLEALFADREDVFVAGDLLWYPAPGKAKAPDAMVVFGRPKGYRGAYIQEREDGIGPQVVFEVLSPNNTDAEMLEKLAFYGEYGVQEYYLWDPHEGQLRAWLRKEDRLQPRFHLSGHVSPLLGVRFELDDGQLALYTPSGERFLSYVELKQRMDEERRRAERAEGLIEQERERAEQERQRAEQERQRAERLAQRLREMGIEPDLL